MSPLPSEKPPEKQAPADRADRTIAVFPSVLLGLIIAGLFVLWLFMLVW